VSGKYHSSNLSALRAVRLHRESGACCTAIRCFSSVASDDTAAASQTSHMRCTVFCRLVHLFAGQVRRSRLLQGALHLALVLRVGRAELSVIRIKCGLSESAACCRPHISIKVIP
jgi:hypothetical protein